MGAIGSVFDALGVEYREGATNGGVVVLTHKYYT
jgi:hypothetical protein